MLIDRIYRVAKERAQMGGISYSLKNLMGYPMRCANNAILEKKRFRLLDEITRADLPSDLKLAHSESPNVIVSVTSYPKRFHALPFCVKSLLLQTVLPDRIIVYLGSDSLEAEIPQELLDYQRYGVEIVIDKSMDLKPHKKYYYAMQQFPNAKIITVDDDLVYPPDMIETLLKASEQYPDEVCARRVHKMTFDQAGNIKPYILWKKQYKAKKPSRSLLATGGGGVLYPPHAFDRKAFDTNAFTGSCLEADDIWLKCMEILAHRRVVYVPSKLDYAILPDTQSAALKIKNTGPAQMNDVFLKRVMEKYGIHPSDFMEEKLW